MINATPPAAFSPEDAPKAARPESKRPTVPGGIHSHAPTLGSSLAARTAATANHPPAVAATFLSRLRALNDRIIVWNARRKRIDQPRVSVLIQGVPVDVGYAAEQVFG